MTKDEAFDLTTEDKIFKLIITETTNIIEDTFLESEIDAKFKEQLMITHFIPIRHRVLGGLYQSINIKFGNFLEGLLKKLIIGTGEYKIVSSININKNIFEKKKFKNLEKSRDINGGKQTCFIISNRNQALIDNYVNECVKADADKDKIGENFKSLLTKIQNNIVEEKSNPNTYDFTTFKNDVDLLFFKTEDNHYFYVELKKEDNHDSGKTKDMYKKVIKTFTCLLYEDYSNCNEELVIKSLTPILLFFGDIKNPSNILPEEYVFSGDKFFDKYLKINFDTINENMCEVSNSKRINDMLMNKNQYILNYSNDKLIKILDEIISNEIKEKMKEINKTYKAFDEILLDFENKINGKSKKLTKRTLINLDLIEDIIKNKELIIKNWNDYSADSSDENLTKVLENINFMKACQRKLKKEIINNEKQKKEELEQKYNKKIIENYNQK